MNQSLIGSMIGVNFVVMDYFLLLLISVFFIIFIALFLIFASIMKKRERIRNIILRNEDFSKDHLAKKKEGKYFWDN
jgi:hypothetical protein